MNDYCYCCDECFEAFELRASMSKTAKYAKGHRVRCPSCGSEATRQSLRGGRGLGGSAEHGTCRPLEAAGTRPPSPNTKGRID